MSHVIRGTEFNYQIDTEYGLQHGFIAEGTESIVYKGIKFGSGLRYSCALKFKPKSRLQDFMNREYKILESLQTCRSVVRVLDVIEELGDFSETHGKTEINGWNYFCVVEEYIDGDSLQDYCIKQWYTYNPDLRIWERNTREYSYREIVKYQNQIAQFMVNLCEIMMFVSNVNEENAKNEPNMPVVLHCDIKPENIMVTQHGKELVLIDFGRSQQFMEGREYQHFSNSGQEIFTADYNREQWMENGKSNFYTYGTVGYAAPESFAAAQQGKFPFQDQQPAIKNGCISIESDIFGFGATFSECFSIYEICSNIFKMKCDKSDPDLFRKRITKVAEKKVREGKTEKYCDRDFREIDLAYHETFENILSKCTHRRNKGFQDPKESSGEYYHNFCELMHDIERARDIVPPLDRKSDPLVRQMLGVSGFCGAFAVCFLVMWILLLTFSNSLARDRWNTLKENYTENQKKTTLTLVAEDMMKVPGKGARRKNFVDILHFMYGGAPNDNIIDTEEAQILTTLLKEYLPDQVEWGGYLDVIIQFAKSEQMDEIAKCVYRMNLSNEFESEGYILAKTLSQVVDADDSDADRLRVCYETLLEYADDEKYKTIIAKLAIKLMTGKKTETIAEAMFTERENIRNTLAPLTGLGDN